MLWTTSDRPLRCRGWAIALIATGLFAGMTASNQAAAFSQLFGGGWPGNANCPPRSAIAGVTGSMFGAIAGHLANQRATARTRNPGPPYPALLMPPPPVPLAYPMPPPSPPFMRVEGQLGGQPTQAPAPLQPLRNQYQLPFQTILLPSLAQSAGALGPPAPAGPVQVPYPKTPPPKKKPERPQAAP